MLKITQNTLKLFVKKIIKCNNMSKQYIINFSDNFNKYLLYLSIILCSIYFLWRAQCLPVVIKDSKNN